MRGRRGRPSLRPHLRGTTRLTLAEPGTGRTYVDREFVLGDGGADRIEWSTRTATRWR